MSDKTSDKTSDKRYKITLTGNQLALVGTAVEGMMNDLISRQAAIDAIKGLLGSMLETDTIGFYEIENVLFEVPSAQPEVKEIGYAECANAMLKMWMDNVLTDGECNRIMDRLNAHYDAERRKDE